MATRIERAQAIANALINGTATATQITRLADAFAVLDLRDPASMTNAQKADLFIARFREFALGSLRRAEGEAAAQQAVAAAAADITDDYAESP